MKKKILSLLSILLVMLFTVNYVSALEVAEAGDVITEEGVYDSLRFVAGNKVTSNANIDGISFVAGNDVYISGITTYGMYAGNGITIGGSINKDLLVAGNKIVILETAFIGRDVYAAGNQIEIKANLPRDLRVGGNTIDISGITINGDAYLDAERIIMNEDTVILGTLTYYDNSIITGIDKASIGNIVTKTIDKVTIEYGFKERLYAYFVSVIAGLITMLCLLYYVPKTKDKLAKLDFSFGNIAKTACIGLAILIVVPLVAFIALFTGFLTPIAIIALACYFIAIYFASLFVSYIVGNLIANKLFKKDDMYLSLAIGIVLVKLVKLIPIVGGYIGAIVLFYGLGIIYQLIKNIKAK